MLNVQHFDAMFRFEARKFFCPLPFLVIMIMFQKKISENYILLKKLVISDIPKPYLPPSLKLNVNNSFLLHAIFKHNIKWKLESYHFRNSTVRVKHPLWNSLNLTSSTSKEVTVLYDVPWAP